MFNKVSESVFGDVFWVILPIMILALVGIYKNEVLELFSGPTIAMSATVISGLALKKTGRLTQQWPLFYIAITLLLVSLVVSVVVAVKPPEIVCDKQFYGFLFGNISLLVFSIVIHICTSYFFEKYRAGDDVAVDNDHVDAIQ